MTTSKLPGADMVVPNRDGRYFRIVGPGFCIACLRVLFNVHQCASLVSYLFLIMLGEHYNERGASEMPMLLTQHALMKCD